ncbi:MAG TPA: TonB-dependent siderophore receptor [Alcaligenes sp.]|nr:TonB-dependent siderophore receptor [Alcaligenes sp.]
MKSLLRRCGDCVRSVYVAAGLAGMALSAPGTPVWAQARGAAAIMLDSRTLAVPAQPLSATINTLAHQWDVAILLDATLAAGRAAPALQGRVSLNEALEQALAGTGLLASPSGSAVIISATPLPPTTSNSEQAQELAAIRVQGKRLAPGVTEGSESYLADSNSTSTRLNLSLRETPQSVSVMTRQRMDDQGLTQLADVAAQTPGLVYVAGGNSGSDSSMIYARGFVVENYMVDGMGQTYSGYRSLFQSNDMVLYDRVEVLRGASGLMNGVGEPGATLNMMRKRPTQDFQFRAKLEGGAWDYYRGEADLSTPLNESGSMRLRTVAAWQDNHSFIDRLHEKKQIFYGIFEADLTPSTLFSLGYTFQKHKSTNHAGRGLPLFYSDGGLIDWDRSTSGAARWAYSSRRNQRLFASLEHRFDNDWTLKGVLDRSETRYDEVLGYASQGFPDRYTGAGVGLWAGRWSGEPVQTSLDISASGPFQLLGREHEAVVGLTSSRTRDLAPSYTLWWHRDWNASVQDIFNWDGRFPSEPANPATGQTRSVEKINSAYATVRFKPSDNLAVLLGGRMTSWSLYKNSLSYASGKRTETVRTANDQFTPYLGLVYDLSDHWSVYGSYTNIFKPQEYRDADGNYLDPRTGNSMEVGLKGSYLDEQLSLGLALFRTRQENFAVVIPGVYGPSGDAAYEAVSGALTRGVELEATGQLSPQWQASASFTRVLAQDRDGKALLTGVPQNTFKLYTTYHLPSVGQGLTVGGGLRWQSGVYEEQAGPLKQRLDLPSVAVFDLMARYTVNKQVSAYLNVNNVFDKHYLTTVNTAVYGSPRAIRAGLDLRF